MVKPHQYVDVDDALEASTCSKSECAMSIEALENQAVERLVPGSGGECTEPCQGIVGVILLPPAPGIVVVDPTGTPSTTSFARHMTLDVEPELVEHFEMLPNAPLTNVALNTVGRRLPLVASSRHMTCTPFTS